MSREPIQQGTPVRSAPQHTSRSASLQVVDLFCGTGGLSHGLTQADGRFELVAGVDADSIACETARANHPRARIICSPVQHVDWHEDLGLTGQDVDLVVGGPPCQGFSSLRPSRGTALEDPRNRLYLEFQRAVEVLRPRAFVLENVVGLVNATRGGLLKDLVAGFHQLGYAVDWRILNAASFGVPQKRERFFLLGFLQEVLGADPVPFPEPTHYFTGRTIGIKDRERLLLADNGALPAVTAWEAFSDLPSVGSGESAVTYAGPACNAYQRAMRLNSRGSALTLHSAANHNEKMRRVMELSGDSRAALPDGLVSSGYSSCYSRISANEPAPTVTVKFTSPASSKCIHPFDNRALTPREAARLQSFPDHFVFRGSKTEIAAQLGNAVPPLMASAFAPVLASQLLARQHSSERAS